MSSLSWPSSIDRGAVDRPVLAGDFLDLLAAHGSRGVPRVDPALLPAQTQATTVFGFQYADGILMAGDRRATAGHAIITDRIDKVLELDGTSLLAIAGAPATAFEMARTLQTSFEYYRRSQLQPLSLPARVRSLSRALRDNLALTLQGIGAVAPLFAGLDTAVQPARPAIYFYDPLGAQFQAAGFAASGSGALTIRSILGYLERFGSPPLSQGDRPASIRLALQVLLVAAEYDSATGGVAPEAARFATIKLLTPDGIESVGDDEQAAAFSGMTANPP